MIRMEVQDHRLKIHPTFLLRLPAAFVSRNLKALSLLGPLRVRHHSHERLLCRDIGHPDPHC